MEIGIRTKAALLVLVAALLWTRDAAAQGACADPDDPKNVMVPAGDFCVDKYEASVWSKPKGEKRYGASTDDYPCGDDGQACSKTGTKIYARSVAGVMPSRRITWHQAAAACQNAGKRLLSNAQWQVAAAGTPDPGAATAPNCNTQSDGPLPAGRAAECVSSWGAHDMIGNLWEWTADWFIAGQHYRGKPTNWKDEQGYTPGFAADRTWSVAGRAQNKSWRTGQPAAALRGGSWREGPAAGVFAFSASYAPSHSSETAGFRCGRLR